MRDQQKIKLLCFIQETVYLLTVSSCTRARPVVKLEAVLSFRGESEQLSLDTKACKLHDGTAVVCTELNACLEYTGVGVDSQLGQYKHFDCSSEFKMLYCELFSFL
jgi:hypothetical protein